MPLLTSEQRDLRDLAWDFASRELRPHAGRRDAAGSLEEGVRTALAESGFYGMLAAEAHGGLGLDLVTGLLVLEELARGDAAVALGPAVHGAVLALLSRHGTPEQRERWLPPLARGEVLGTFPLAEDPAGGLLASSRDGAWVLTGLTRWLPHGAGAGLALVVAGPSDGGDADVFLVEPGAEGCELSLAAPTMGLRASGLADGHLDGVRLAGGGLLEGAGDGLARAALALDLVRVSVAALAVGVARAAEEHAAAYALERRQFGRRIADFGAVRDKLAGMRVRIAAARELVLEAGRRVQAVLDRARADGSEGAAPSAVVAAAKLVAGEAAMWTADEAVQIFGGYGYMRDYPVEKLMRDAKGLELLGGSADRMRREVARDVIRAAGGEPEG